MARIEFIAKFDGELAEEHKLPALQGTQSIQGITRSILVPANYLFEGRVRRRRFREIKPYRFNITAQREGSFETVFEFVTDPKFVGGAAAFGLALSANFVSSFVISMIKRSIGGQANEDIEAHEREERLPSGDLAAVVDAIEPGVRQSHLTIENGATAIFINGDNNTVEFNPVTKAYVNNTNSNDLVRVKSMSVASFNSNTGYGRLFDAEEGRTIPFQISRDFDRESIAALLHSFTRYTRRRWAGADDASIIAVQYTSLDALDGRIKKIFPLRARREMDDLKRPD